MGECENRGGGRAQEWDYLDGKGCGGKAEMRESMEREREEKEPLRAANVHALQFSASAPLSPLFLSLPHRQTQLVEIAN